MQVQQLQSKQNFTGHFQGIVKHGDITRLAPIREVYTCPYADKMMLRVIGKILNRNNANSLKISGASEGETRKLVFEVGKSDLKKNIPFFVRITKGKLSDLSNPIFWKILKKDNTQGIKYSFTDKELKGMVKYFERYRMDGGYTPSECPSIGKKVAVFKQALLSKVQGLDKNWINEFFE